jgi:endonuclease/exonuclease/phosphatase family metal-dependent hydrolase
LFNETPDTMLKKYLVLSLFIFLSFYSFAETDFYFENNTTLDFNITTTQWSTNDDPLESDEWTPFNGTSYAWQSKLRVLRVNRDDGIHNGSDFYQEVLIEHNGESFTLQCRLEGEFLGSDMDFSVKGNGFDHSWHGQNNGNFHEETIMIGGKQLILKYKRENNIPYEENIRFALHEVNPHTHPDPNDLTNPNIMNLMSYNVALLMPVGVADQDENERAEHLYTRIPMSMDVLVAQEAFDLADEFLGSLFTDYSYQTTSLNAATVDIPGVTKDGGVYIISKWPIEMQADLDFQSEGIPCDNGAWNCAARKGVKYARINKLGTIYHIFGTHLEAGNAGIRLQQLDAFQTFMNSFNIPKGEAIIFAGDFNIGMNDDENDYEYIRNILSAIEATRLGTPYVATSLNFNHYKDNAASSPDGNIIDHAFGNYSNLMPVFATNETWNMRSIHNDMWGIYDLSDHEAVMGHFVYPEVTEQPGDTEICKDGTIQISVASDVSPVISYQWYLDEAELVGETNASLSVFPFDVNNVGDYHCEISYTYTPDVSINSTLTDYPYVNPGLIEFAMPTNAASLNLTVNDCTPTIMDNNGTLESDYDFGTYQWYDENGPIDGATDPNFGPTESGIYYVVVSYNGNDSNPSNEIQIILQSNEELLGNHFTISPNPSNGLFYVNFENTFNSEITFEWYNAQGQLMMNKIATGSTSFDLSRSAAGMYCLKMTSEGEHLARKVVLR